MLRNTTHTLRALRQLSTSTSAATVAPTATAKATAAATAETKPYITFAQYRVLAAKSGPLAAVRQAYPRSLNTENELKRAAERAQNKA